MPKRLKSLAEKCEVCVFSIPKIDHDAFELAANADAGPEIRTSQKHRVMRILIKNYVRKKSKENKIDYYNQALNLFNTQMQLISREQSRQHKRKEKINEFKVRNALLSTLLIFITLIFLPSVLASSITTDQNSFAITKLSNETPSIQIKITNTEPFDILNVTLQDNTYVQMDLIPLLHSGETRNITLRIFSTSTVNTTLSLFGFFFQDIGQPFKRYEINVSQQSPPQLNPCDFSVIKGDIVSWRNTLQFDPLTMKTQAGQTIDGSTIQPSQIYERTFGTVEQFSYFWSRFSVPITPICTITVLNPQGYVHDPQRDTKINFDIHVTPQLTSIDASVNPNQLTISLLEAKEGTLFVQNVGTQTAFQVHITNDWMTFSANDFDLTPGQSRGVVFSATPVVFSTNETNKTYTKSITITGNFNTKELPVNIFVPFAIIGGDANLSDSDYLLNVFCPRYPHSVLCEKTPRIEYRYIFNQSDREFNISISQQRIDDLWIYLFSLGDAIKTYRNADKIKIEEISVSNNQTASDIGTLKDRVITMDEDRRSTANFIIYFIAIFFIVFACTIAVTLIFLYSKKKRMESLRTW